jgi:hypothetical protein
LVDVERAAHGFEPTDAQDKRHAPEVAA